MKRTQLLILLYLLSPGALLSGQDTVSSNPVLKCYYTKEELQEDFLQFRENLESKHCCLYEYSSKPFLDSIFDARFTTIDRDMRMEEFFTLLAPISARVGCMHTATWMPGRFFGAKPGKMFPLKLKLIDEAVVVTGSHQQPCEIPFGSIIHEMNGLPADSVISRMRFNTSADALNPYFKDAQLTHRFSMFYASTFGIPDQYQVRFTSPYAGGQELRQLVPAHIDSVRRDVFSHFNTPPLEFRIMEKRNTALLKIRTFIYYDKVDYFRGFIDSCFHLLKEQEIENLILDLRGNGGGDPFCASALLSYLQYEPVPYFAEPYGRYAELASPLPHPDNHFTGDLYTIIDGSCGSTNGHFCALLRYHQIGKFVGTPSGSTFKCNAGRDTEFQLDHTGMIITVGRSTFSAAVDRMDKHAPIMPDIPVVESHDAFLERRDLFLEKALDHIEIKNTFPK
jgi:hypothetical protein